MRMKIFSNLEMKISTILTAGFAAMVFLIVGIGAAAFWVEYKMGNAVSVSYVRIPMMSYMKDINSALASANAIGNMLTYLDPQSEGFEEAAFSYTDKLDGAEMGADELAGLFVDEKGNSLASDKDQKLFTVFKAAFQKWKNSVNQHLEALPDYSAEERESKIDEIGSALFDAIDALAALELHSFETADQANKDGQSTGKWSKRILYTVCFVGLICAVFLTLGITRFIVKPIMHITDGVSRMAGGDLKIDMDESSRLKEISLLMRGFSAMLNTLRDQVSGLTEGAGTIAASTSQISTTATELASTASEASISVNQITTTTEEVKQTVQLSSEKANQVADAAEEVARVADRGRRATEDAVSGMNRIKEEMEYIAESIVKLSEQTQSIGEIIDAVNDLANESNLLSVNASIEAAKAGEFGKGFAVVAQEVKSLSDQSKQATAQVRTILNDIQNATSQAVMATERGSKAVDDGVELASSSGHAIRALSDSISGSAKSAAQIAASSRQQLAGIDQLSQAMASIQDAAGQNVEGAKRLEDATRDLDEIAGALQDLAVRFKV